MPVFITRGIALSLEFRILLFTRFHDGFSAQQIFQIIFGGVSIFISWRHVKFLLNKFLTDEEFTRVFLLGPAKKTGRISIMNPDERSLLTHFVALDSVKILQIMKRDFIEFYHGNIEEHPYSMTTFKREFLKARLSFKVIERRNILCDDAEGLRFLDRIAHIDPLDLNFGDEMSSDPKSFHKKMGWSPVGDECRRYQLNIGTRTFSTVAVVCALGFDFHSRIDFHSSLCSSQ